jgi:hypothetical protein
MMRMPSLSFDKLRIRTDFEDEDEISMSSW